MTTTEQIRRAAEEIAEYNGMYAGLRSTPESVISAYERIITRNVQSAGPTLTDAIAEVERLRDRYRDEMHKSEPSSEYYYAMEQCVDALSEALRALQGKAGVGDCSPENNS